MEFTRLGSSGLTVSRICLDCMSYGSSGWRPWFLDEEDARPFCRSAVEYGINFFDTADMYALGVSEEVTGRALREYGIWGELGMGMVGGPSPERFDHERAGPIRINAEPLQPALS